MNEIPVSTLFIGINGLIALVLSYIVAMERTRTRVWHGESPQDVARQPKYSKPSAWAAFVEKLTQKLAIAEADDGLLQRKVRAHGNFTEYVPLALLFLMALELMQQNGLVWLLGSTLTLGRMTHAYGLIKTYGPSPARAIGFFLTWFVYGVGAGACIYFSWMGIIG